MTLDWVSGGKHHTRVTFAARSYITIELIEGLGLDTNTFNSVVYNDEFKNPNWRKVSAMHFVSS